MNIFFTNIDPKVAARELCDDHVNKMLVESAQMLSTTLRQLAPPSEDDPEIYRTVHKNHTSRLWAGESLENFQWLLTHAKEIAVIYEEIKRNRHATTNIIENIEILLKYYKSLFPSIELTPIRFAMGGKVNSDEVSYDDIKERYGFLDTETSPDFICWRANDIKSGTLAYQEYIRRKVFLPRLKVDREGGHLRAPVWEKYNYMPVWYTYDYPTCSLIYNDFTKTMF